MSKASETLYDADSSVEARASKKRGAQKLADRGDTKTIDGEEYESRGYMKKVKPAEGNQPATYESDMPEQERKGPMEPDEKDLPRPGGGTEFWRRKKPAERPMS